MKKYIVVETEEFKAHLVAAGLDRLAKIVVSGIDAGQRLTGSLAMGDFS